MNWAVAFTVPCQAMLLHRPLLKCTGMPQQVSGIRYLHTDGAFFSASLLNADGSTSPIDPKGRYTVVATDYMLQVSKVLQDVAPWGQQCVLLHLSCYNTCSNCSLACICCISKKSAALPVLPKHVAWECCIELVIAAAMLCHTAHARQFYVYEGSRVTPFEMLLLLVMLFLPQGGDGYSFPGAQVLLPAGDPYVDVVLADLKKHPEGVSGCYVMLCYVGHGCHMVVVYCTPKGKQEMQGRF
jgi:hypothetical protein